MSPRQELIHSVAESILALPRKNVVRVGIDGDAGAGKSCFGDELQTVLMAAGRPVIRASTDSFHHPREIRYRLGKTSPEGFYRDSFDYPAITGMLLFPLSDTGSGRFHRASFDHRANLPVESAEEKAQPNSVLVFDGLFLHRPELAGFWDYSIFLDVTPETGLMRCAMRGDGSPDPTAESNVRYVQGQRMYLEECRPASMATIVIDNEVIDRPRIKR